MSKARIAVLVSGGGTNLQALIDAGIPSGELALVVASRPGVFALERAYNAGIPSMVIAKKGRTQEEFEKELCAALDEYKIDLIVLAGFLTILSEDFTKRYPRRIINIHPSLNPSFCGEGFYGLRVHEAALARGVKLTGATVLPEDQAPHRQRGQGRRHAGDPSAPRDGAGRMDPAAQGCRNGRRRA